MLGTTTRSAREQIKLGRPSHEQIARKLYRFITADPIELARRLGECIDAAVDDAVKDLGLITGRKPVVNKSRKSVANFKLRKGQAIGCRVTLRRDVMYEFFDRLVAAALPRIRDFRGVPGKSFDGRGNFSLGLREQLAFPEIEYDKVDRLRGLEISIVTTAKTDEESKRLLELLGMPFAG